jgi:hypothetical protein
MWKWIKNYLIIMSLTLSGDTPNRTISGSVDQQAGALPAPSGVLALPLPLLTNYYMNMNITVSADVNRDSLSRLTTNLLQLPLLTSSSYLNNRAEIEIPGTSTMIRSLPKVTIRGTLESDTINTLMDRVAKLEETVKTLQEEITELQLRPPMVHGGRLYREAQQHFDDSINIYDGDAISTESSAEGML